MLSRRMMEGRQPWSRSGRLGLFAGVLAGLLLSMAAPVASQEIQGRIVDAENGAPVGLAAVVLLNTEREPIEAVAADLEGRYSIHVPGNGEFYLYVERLGYFENESPLLAVTSDGTFGADFEMRPEPFRLDPLDVVVSNEALEDFLTLEFGQHPASVPGYRAYQGVRLAEAQAKAVDSTDLLRWLYIPITHGRQVCLGTFGAGTELPARMGYERTMAAAAESTSDGFAQCGALYLDGILCRNEHIESIDRRRIGAVVVTPGVVRLYTRDFDWTLRPGGQAGGC